MAVLKIEGAGVLGLARRKDMLCLLRWSLPAQVWGRLQPLLLPLLALLQRRSPAGEGGGERVHK